MQKNRGLSFEGATLPISAYAAVEKIEFLESHIEHPCKGLQHRIFACDRFNFVTQKYIQMTPMQNGCTFEETVRIINSIYKETEMATNRTNECGT